MRKLLLALVILLAGCGMFDGFGAEVGDCADVGVKYEAPDYVKVVEESCVPGSGPGNAAYEAEFKIAPVDLEAFQATTGLTDWTEDKIEADVFAEEAVQPGSALLAKYSDGNYLREVLIDTSNPNEYTVHYYHAFVD